MLETAKLKALPVVNRAVDYAPAAQACCGVCRTCTTTNAVTFLTAGAVTLAAYSRRIVRRLSS